MVEITTLLAYDFLRKIQRGDRGVRLIWVVNPRTRSVHVYRPPAEVRRLSESDTLSGEDVLPGLAVPVAEIFA